MPCCLKNAGRFQNAGHFPEMPPDFEALMPAISQNTSHSSEMPQRFPEIPQRFPEMPP